MRKQQHFGGRIGDRWVYWLSALLLGVLVGFPVQALAQPSGSDRPAVHLTLWHGISPPSNREIFQTLVQRFNQAHPDIEVEPLYLGQPDQQIPKILTGVVGGAPPDLLWYVPTLPGQLVELEAIRPLEEWLAQTGLQQDIDPVLFESMTMEGHIWSIPFATNNAGIFYRPSLFQAAGITDLPKTWDDLQQVAQRLTQDRNGDGRIDQRGLWLSLGKGEWNVFVWLPFVLSAGGELVQNGKPTLVNPGTMQALQFGADLVRQGVAVLSPPERGYETDSFINGEVAMQVTGPWTLHTLDASGVDYDAFPIPQLDKPAAVVGGEHLFVFKTSPEKERAALTFLAFILGEEFQTEWAIQTGYLPVSLKVRASAAYQAFMAQHPVLQVFLDQMQWARSRPVIPGYHYLSENFGRAIEAALLGRPVEAALQEAQARLDLILGND